MRYYYIDLITDFTMGATTGFYGTMDFFFFLEDRDRSGLLDRVSSQ